MVYYSTAPWPQQVFLAVRDRIAYNVKEYILFFGTVDKYKGVDLLVDAYCNLTCKSLKLVIAGRGFDIETHNENIIRINRFIEDEEVAYLFKKAKFIVYPYRSATMSGVLSLAYYFKFLSY